jgi:hypothetical protein
MALGKRQNANTVFLNIVGGKITQRVNKDTEGAKERILAKGPKAGTPVYELEHDFVSGKIVHCEIKESDYGDQIELKLRDGDDFYVLTVNWDYARLRDAIVKRLPNIDVAKPVEISCFPDREDGQPAFFIRQDGEVVKYAFTRDNPNGLPEPTKKVVKGKEEWVWDEPENFLWDKAQEWFEQFAGNEKPDYQDESESAETTSKDETNSSEDIVDEDVPF